MTRSAPAAARVALVGAGGLGGPLALALASAGQQLVIFDDDVVEPSNLHRQLQFTLAEVGQRKAMALAAAVQRRGGRARAVTERWTPARADADADAHGPCQLILDGSDDPLTKFAVADWAAARQLPSVIAGALGTGGNAFASAPGAACFRCLFEQQPAEAATCAQAGVLGPVVAAVAGLAAQLALRLARGDRRVAGSIWVLEDLRRPPRQVSVPARSDCGCARGGPLQTAGAMA